MNELDEGFGAIYHYYYGNQDGAIGGPVWRENPLLEKHIRAMANGTIPTLTVGALLSPEQPLTEKQLEEQAGHHFAAVYANYFAAPANRYHGVQNAPGPLESDFDPLEPSPVKKSIVTLLRGMSASDVVGSMLV